MIDSIIANMIYNGLSDSVRAKFDRHIIDLYKVAMASSNANDRLLAEALRNIIDILNLKT